MSEIRITDPAVGPVKPSEGSRFGKESQSSEKQGDTGSGPDDQKQSGETNETFDTYLVAKMGKTAIAATSNEPVNQGERKKSHPANVSTNPETYGQEGRLNTPSTPTGQRIDRTS
jgi:hypothetical protein